MELQLQVNSSFVKNDHPIISGNHVVLVTPPIDENYWVMRVPLSDKQAIVCFPKFGTVGIGFQHEEDWNTNLPYQCDACTIFNHISHNKGDDSIPDEDCIKAIEMLQNEIRRIADKKE